MEPQISGLEASSRPIPSIDAVPQAFVDAGDTPWPALEPIVRRTLASLLAGHVLELATGDPETMETLPGWCAGEGHTLINHEPGDGVIYFWIGKR
jgi:TusA-related sulfurtransferase